MVMSNTDAWQPLERALGEYPILRVAAELGDKEWCPHSLVQLAHLPTQLAHPTAWHFAARARVTLAHVTGAARGNTGRAVQLIFW